MVINEVNTEALTEHLTEAVKATVTSVLKSYTANSPEPTEQLDKDQFGFGINSGASFIAAGLVSGKFTRKTLLDAFMDKFSDGTSEDDAKKKTSFNVFISDVKRPVGMYSVSRGFDIKEDLKGILSVTRESMRAARR